MPSRPRSSARPPSVRGLPAAPARKVQRILPPGPLYADEFVQGRNYTNWRPHGTQDWLLIYTQAGSGAVAVPEGMYHTRPGDLLLYEPNSPEDYSTDKEAGNWHLLWAHFVPRPSWQALLEWPLIGSGLRLVRMPPEMREVFHDAFLRVIRAHRSPLAVGAELAMTALKEALLWAHATQGDGPHSPLDPRILRAVTWLTHHFKEPLYLPDLARECGLSVSHFSHVFRSQLGQTPGQFLERQKLLRAENLLRWTSLSVAEIAAECGFENPFYFSNRFRKHYRQSPRGFRGQLLRPGCPQES